MRKHRVQLGLGLISIGRTWGARPVPVPGAAEALAFLEGAYELGLRLFDTSPSLRGQRGEAGALPDGPEPRTAGAGERRHEVRRALEFRNWRTVHRPFQRRPAPEPGAEPGPARRDRSAAAPSE